MYSPERIARIDQLRAISQTRRLTREEQAEIISTIRVDRVSASYASAAARKPTAKVDGEALLAGLMGAA